MKIDPIEYRAEIHVGGYEWRLDSGGKRWLFPKGGDPELTRAEFSAQRSPTVLHDFVTIGGLSANGEDMSAALLKFANRYGPLGVAESVDLGAGKVFAESLSEWQAEAELLWESFAAWDNADRGDLEAMNGWIAKIGMASARRVEVTEAGGTIYSNYEALPEAKPKRHSKKEDAARALKELVVAFVDASQAGLVEGRVVFEGNRAPYRLVPKSLLGCLWLSFALSLDQGSEVHKCRECGESFMVALHARTRRSRGYCSRACKTAAYRSRQKKARELAAAGESVESVVAQLNEDGIRPIREATVRGWIEKAAAK